MASVATGVDGKVTLRVQAGENAGNGTIVFTVDPSLNLTMAPGYDSITCSVTVKEPAQIVIPDPIIDPEPEPEPDPVDEKKDYDYTVEMTYGGSADLSMVEALVFVGKTCDELNSELTLEKVGDLKGDAEKNASLLKKKVEDISLKFTFEETDAVDYAVVGRAVEGKEYVAAGCIDGMNRDNSDVIVVLTDLYEPPELDYSGKFALTSQFNALSLLPHADVEGTVLFKDMLLGDWIQFALNFLSNPEEGIVNVIKEQVLPLLLNTDFIRNLIEKYLGITLTEESTEGLIDIIDKLGLTKLIEDNLSALTGQLDWWSTATGAVEIVNNLATNFTLYGNFTSDNNKLNDQNILEGIQHNYSSLLYHNGNFTDCKLGKAFSKDAKGKTICEVSISTLDKSHSVSGSFDATFSEITDAAGLVQIHEHSLQLAYGKIIYAALVQILPKFIANMPNDTDSLGKIVAYFIGDLLVNLNNKKANDGEEGYTTIEGAVGCDAIGKSLANLLKNVPAIGNYIDLVGAATITSLCNTGIGALDGLIDTQLGKLSVSSEAVTFSSENCNVRYVTDDHDNPSNIAYFGVDEHKWGSKVTEKDLCKWKVSITTKSTDGDGNETSKVSVIDGKFWAVGSMK